MKAIFAVLLIGAAVAGAQSTFEERKMRLIRYHAGPNPQTNPKYGHLAAIASKLWLRQDAEWCSQRLRELLKDPSGDMFWMFAVTAIRYVDRGQLTEEARVDLRKAWKTYFPYRGDTENHWLLYYTSLYLSSQIEPGASWFTGKTSKENMQEAGDYIRSWIDLTLDKGQGEYDCTHYLGVYLLPLSYLAAWSEDADLKQRAKMMTEYITADFAAESLNGIFVGSHARTDDRQVLEKSWGVSSEFAWLFFNQGNLDMPIHSSYSLYYSLASAQEPHEALKGIATDRSKPYVHRERKRTRNRWRYNDEKNGKVYKTTYMSANYAVGSDQGGVLQPIQQHSWDVTWAVPNSRGVHNTLFTTHPYSSGYELQMYFTPMPDYFLDEVLRSKKTYDSPDKWIGGSPFEKIMQDLDTVIALYDIPPGTRFPHIHGFFSKDLAKLEEDKSGWIFVQGGDAYIAYFPLAPYEWKKMENGGRELFSPHLKNGAIVQAANASEFASFAEFQAKIKSLRLTQTVSPTPSVDFQSLRGHRLQFTYGKAPLVDSKPIDYEHWPMFDSPFLEGEPGTRRLEMRYGRMRHVLDFNNLTVQDSIQ